MSEALLQNASALRRAGRLTEAADLYTRVLQSEPQHFEALHALGIIRYQGGQLAEAERLIGEAVRIKPSAADALYNRACLLQKLGRTEDALAAFASALGVKPDYVEALVNRGSLLMSQNRHDLALTDFDTALRLRPNLPQIWNNRASALVRLSRFEEAAGSADRALSIASTYADAWRNRGSALLGSRRFADALESFGRTLSLDANASAAWTGKGHALAELGRTAEAFESYGRAVQLAPQDADALYHRAVLHFKARAYEDAAQDLRPVLVIDPAYPYARGMLAFCAASICDFANTATEANRALQLLRNGAPALAPFECIAISDDPNDHLAAATLWADRNLSLALTAKPGRAPDGRIRVAYLSGNFYDHAVARLLAGVIECHDRSRFEIIGLSFGPDDGSALRGRLGHAFDRFIDIRSMSDAEAAATLAALEPDIAVDLMGYTEGCRPHILLQHPAPTQVNFLGFPGTMGSPHIDYLLADEIVIPKPERGYYREQVVYLPHTYLPNDDRRSIAPSPSRREAGLPDEGFVFASFNAPYKLSASMFAIWMRLLCKLPGSLLWLGQMNGSAERQLRLEAGTRRVDPERIVFAPYARDTAAHLARLSLADLMLDTLPYNSHATACDALWAGVPLLTCAGSSFAARVGASVLRAAGLSELVTHTAAEYEALALRLAGEPEALAGIRAKLGRQNARLPLFDTARFTRDLETAFETMQARRLKGEAPASFAVSDDTA